MKGAWVLRRAWKIYQRTYTDIRRLYVKRVGIGGNNSIGLIYLIYSGADSLGFVVGTAALSRLRV